MFLSEGISLVSLQLGGGPSLEMSNFCLYRLVRERFYIFKLGVLLTTLLTN